MTAALLWALGRFWGRLREWSGDAAYETYLARATGREPLLSREAFYLDGLRRRYQSGQPNRCC
ncbi:MAG TPA: CstA-like transporter-associated (seleno)protein [Vicinamibacteria bacterium]